MDIDKTGILDKLLAKEVISHEDNETLNSEHLISQDKNRILLGKIIRKNILSAYSIFLEILKEDICYEETAVRIEETEVFQIDIELLCIGRRIRERKRNGMSDLMIDTVEKWEKDDSLYIKTKATNYVLVCIRKHSSVSVIGPSGSGKSALVSHVALQMERQGYTIVSVTDAKEIKDNYKHDRKTLYIVDDICGNFTANQSRIEEWKKSIKDIENILKNSKCKLILTCRLQVFQDKGFDNLEIFKSCECNLRSKDLSLTSDEKEAMTTQYFKEHACVALNHLGKYEFLPLLCKIYHVEKTNPQFTLEMFLNDPFSFYKKDLTHMYNDCKEGKYKYCALLLLVIYNNKIEGGNITGNDPKNKEIIEDIVNVFDMDENITGRKLKTHLEILIGTFVTYEEDIYRTIHDKLFDFLAFYFGTQEDIIGILIKHAKARFIRERFVFSGGNESIHYSIPISDKKLQMYIKRVFDDIVSSSKVDTDIAGNINLKNKKFRTMLLDVMEHISKDEKYALMERASSSFLNTMFVMRKEDIKDYFEDWSQDRFEKYNCFGIILTDDMLQQYIEKWFKGLIKTVSTQIFMQHNRLLTCVTFRTALQSFMKQLSPEDVALCIQTVSANFRNTMFVIREHDAQVYCMRNYLLGIVIPDSLLQQYIERIFDDFTKSDELESDINENIPLMNVTFRTAFRSYIRQFTTEKIASLIQTANDGIINIFFVMTEEELKKSSNIRYECFGIVIPDDQLQQYCQRFFNDLTKSDWLQCKMNKNRPLKSLTFRSAFRTYIRQLHSENIASLIQRAGDDFFNLMFCMKEEDIRENDRNQYECFGIVIPDNLLQQYCQRLCDNLAKTVWVGMIIIANRPLRNVTFCTTFCNYLKQLTKVQIASLIQTVENDFLNNLFFIAEEDIKENVDNHYKCFCIVIPDDLLQQYCQRLFDNLTKHHHYSVERNRLLMNITFRATFCTYINQLTKAQIASIIQTAEDDFINEMFVMTEQDINDNAKNQYECFGIVIPSVLLQQYIQRWFDNLAKTYTINMIEDNLKKTRPLMNSTFRSAFRTYIRQLSTDKIDSLILRANTYFINQMFVMTEEDIEEHAENRYEWFGIVIPDDLLQKYIQRWFDDLINTRDLDEFMDKNRPLKNVKFCNALCNYTKKLNAKKIAYLIKNADGNFMNIMFIMSEDDVKVNVKNRYECFGIIISCDLLQQYIERWFKCLTTTELDNFLDRNRPLGNVSFCTALRTFMKELNREEIANLIQTGSTYFFNKMFVMTENDIKDECGNRFEWFGIIIPADLLHQYITRWSQIVVKNNSLEEYMNANRPSLNVKFQAEVRTCVEQLDKDEIGLIIDKASDDFINTMFVMTEDDIKDNGGNRYEWSCIVIPADIPMLQQYIERWFRSMKVAGSVKEYMNANRQLTNANFRTALRTYISKLDTKEIEHLFYTGSSDFLNTMFVLTENDIESDHAYYRFESFGIVIPDDILQLYTSVWMYYMKKTDALIEFVGANRSSMSVIMQTELEPYINQINLEK